MDIEDFTICHEFESVSLILSLVKQDAGITFIYEEVARNYIEQGILQPLLPDMFSIERQFTFVALPAMPFTEDNEFTYSERQDALLRDHPGCTHGLVLGLKENTNIVFGEKDEIRVCC